MEERDRVWKKETGCGWEIERVWKRERVGCVEERGSVEERDR